MENSRSFDPRPVPIPPRSYKGREESLRSDIRRLEVGQSLLDRKSSLASVRVTAAHISREWDYARSFKTLAVDGGVRCWRLK